MRRLIVCPEHNLPINQRVHWVNGRFARLCAACVAERGWTWLKVNPEFDRLFNQILDEIFGPDPPGKKPKPMSNRELRAILDHIAANGYAPPSEH